MPERQVLPWIVALTIGAIAASPIVLVVAVGPPHDPDASPYVLAVLAAPGRPGSPAFDWNAMGVDVTASRHLGRALQTDVWVAQTEVGSICLGMEGDIGPVVRCVPLADFRRYGLFTGPSHIGGDDAIEAILLPDGMDLDEPLGPWHLVGDNVLLATVADAQATAAIVLQREGGDPFTLVP